MENEKKNNQELCSIDVDICSLTDSGKTDMVKKLRMETGWGLMDCKRALSECEWSYDEAKNWLIQFRKKSGILFS